MIESENSVSYVSYVLHLPTEPLFIRSFNDDEIIWIEVSIWLCHGRRSNHSQE
jgi:hypothetical protein